MSSVRSWNMKFNLRKFEYSNSYYEVRVSDMELSLNSMQIPSQLNWLPGALCNELNSVKRSNLIHSLESAANPLLRDP